MILTSCSQRVEHNWFQYYDLFTLQGKAPLTKTGFGYPYVAINTSGDSTTIKHVLSAKDSFTTVYTRKGNWIERVIYDTAFPKASVYHEFIRNDSMIIVVYDLASVERVAAIGIYNRNQLTTYGLDTVFYRKFSLDSAIAYATNMKSGLLATKKFESKSDSVIVLTKNKYMYKPDFSYSKRFGFYNSGASLDWWMIYEWKYYKYSIFSETDNLKRLGVDPIDL
jgi:hypothetical protein